MRRLDLPELAEQSWWPAWARDAMTGYLHEIITRARPYSLAVPTLSALFRDAGVTHVIDLCSGAGGPWPGLRQVLETARCTVSVTCSDLAPNRAAAGRLERSGVRYHDLPVNATAVPPSLPGARTMFSALHHFSDREVAAILEDAQRAGVPFAAFEATSRSLRGLMATAIIPIAVLVLMPFVRPRDWRALLLTYLPPVLPLAIWWDGLISTLRTSTVDELQAIVDSLPSAPYAWTIAEIGGGPVPILAVCGRPTTDRRGAAGGSGTS